MKSKKLVCAIIASVMTVFLGLGLTVPTALAQVQGPAIDRIRYLTIKSPDAVLIAAQTGQIDFAPGLIRPADIEKLAGDGWTITSQPGFHMGFVAYNLHRPVLDNVNFRHACFLAYNQEAIVPSIYGYTVTAVQSLVPPAQGGWMAPDVPKYPFNPGDITDAPGTESTFGIMQLDYDYHGTGHGDLDGFWTNKTTGDPLPSMIFWTPTYEVAPTSAEHGARIAAEWARCGLGNIEHVPADFNTYTNSVFNLHDFDIFMIFWRLGRFPLQLYGMAHSSEYVPGSDNPVGIMDPILDDLLEELKYGLDHDAKVAACHEAQRRMYDSTLPYALSHMLLYSRVYFNAAAPGLMGIVNQPGYGSDNGWTESNWRWEPGHPNERIVGGESLVIYCNGEEAPHRNPLFVETVYEANVIEPTLDAGIAVHPYDLTDVAWQDDNWVIEGPITETITLDSDIDGGQYAGMNAGDSFNIIDGMKITYNFVDDLYFQDGNPCGADDMEFSLEFLRDNEIPQYITTWQDIVDVQQVNSTAWTVYCNQTSQFLVYYWSDPLLSTEVWGPWDGQPLAGILAYEPTTDYADTGPWSYPDGPDGQPGTGDDPDPTNIGPKTKMFGTGPFVYDYYDAVGMVAEVHAWREQGANVGYFKTTDEIAAIKTVAFWNTGDVDGYDGLGDIPDPGWVWTNDKFRWGQAYLSHKPPHPEDARWDIAADVNEDTVVDWEDGGRISANWGEFKEYGP